MTSTARNKSLELAIKSFFSMAKQYNNIKEVLYQKRVKQTELADMLGVHRGTISRICSNHTQPSLDLLFKIAEVLKVPVTDLIGTGEDDNK